MKRARRARMFGIPLGASLAIAAIPGPCTTFDDVTPPDASYTPQCGLALNFSPDEPNCQYLVDQAPGCCTAEEECADSGPCKKWVGCVNDACAPGTLDASCARPCGSTNPFASIALKFNTCRDNAFRPDECQFLPETPTTED